MSRTYMITLDSRFRNTVEEEVLRHFKGLLLKCGLHYDYLPANGVATVRLLTRDAVDGIIDAIGEASYEVELLRTGGTEPEVAR